jgi:DNA-binding LacI/PurR family transcriptional regulator
MSNKIWKIVRELGYIPNQNAKNLVKGHIESELGNKSIGCLYASTSDVKTDPFFSSIGVGIQEELRKQGYEMAFSLSTYNMAYAEVYKYINNHPAKGIVITGLFEREILELVKKNFEFIVYAGVNAVESGIDEVVCDGYKGARTAISHLISQGHKKIGYIGYTHFADGEYQLVNEHRYRAYSDILEESNLEISKSNVIHTRLYTTAAYEAMTLHLKQVNKETMATAYYCANDATAFGVMKALQESGYKIPSDVSVIGLDDVEMAQFVTLTLSTISIPRQGLGIQAVKLLIDRIESNRDYSIRVDLPFELKIRQSSNYKLKNES